MRVDRDWSDYPIGTKAHAVMGGYWIRVQHGWKWFNGSAFPTPGGDACGACIELPKPAASPAQPSDDWRSIDSAPRDGTVVMFHVPGQYAPHMGRGDDWHGGFAYWLKGATHWRPLPEHSRRPFPRRQRCKRSRLLADQLQWSEKWTTKL